MSGSPHASGAPASRPTEARGEVPSLARLAILLALVAAAFELATVWAQQPVFGRFAFVGADVWWTVPLVNTILFAAIAGAFAACRLLLPRLSWWRIGTWLFVFLGALSVLYYFPELHRAAAVLVAAGVATQILRMLSSRSERVAVIARRATRWLVVAALVTMALVRGTAIWREHRSLASLPPAPPGAPNVLLIVLDTVRAKSLGLHGYARATSPRLEAWAARGVTFSHAFATSPWTLPSHASLVTGRWEHELTADWTRPLDRAHPTIAGVLASHGYATAGIVANTDYTSGEVGLSRGFAHFEDYVLSPGLMLRSAALGRAIGRSPLARVAGSTDQLLGRKDAPDISASFLAWLDRRQDRPWFALLNYYDAHRPYLPPEPFYSKFGTAAVPPDPRFRQNDDPNDPWTDEDARRFMTAYDGALAYLDSEIGALLDALERRGALDRTLVIVTSDHGEEFGEHRLYDHGNSLYLASLHVPLVVVAPGWTPPRTVVEGPVSLRDVPATILDFVNASAATPLPGRSLARFWNAAESPSTGEIAVSGVRQVRGQPPWYPVSRGDLVSLTDGPLRYIRNLGDGTEELFDYRLDPDERVDLSRRAEYSATILRLRSRIEASRRMAAVSR